MERFPNVLAARPAAGTRDGLASAVVLARDIVLTVGGSRA